MSVGWALSTLILDLSSFFSCWSFWFSRLLSFFLCFHDNLVLFGCCTMLNITKTQHLSSFVKFHWISFESRFLINFVTKIIFGIFLDIFVLFFRISFETRFLINSVTKNNFGHFCSFFEFYSTIYKLNIFRLFTIFVNSFTNLEKYQNYQKYLMTGLFS